MLQTPGDYWVRQGAKLLTYCSCVLHDNFNDLKAIKGIHRQLDNVIAKTEADLAELNEENNDLDKDMICKLSDYLKYLRKCRNELEKLAEK